VSPGEDDNGKDGLDGVEGSWAVRHWASPAVRGGGGRPVAVGPRVGRNWLWVISVPRPFFGFKTFSFSFIRFFSVFLFFPFCFFSYFFSIFTFKKYKNIYFGQNRESDE
jgi:hypothetical protein